MIDTAGGGAPKTAEGGYGGSATGEPPLPPLDVAGQSSTSRAGWARETAGSGLVSGAVAHLSKSRRAAQQREAIADRMLGMGDHRPVVGRGWTIGRHCGAVGTFDVCSNAAVNSDLSY